VRGGTFSDHRRREVSGRWRLRLMDMVSVDLPSMFHVEQFPPVLKVNYFFFAGAGKPLIRTAVSRKILGWEDDLSGSGRFPPFHGTERK
jgi:hypothetical protein